jgi:hypothetical protein
MEGNKHTNNNHYIQVSEPLTQSRPKTPHIDVIEIRELKKFNSAGIIKNFTSFMEQIIDNNNINFLNGGINVIEYIISKYTGVCLEEVQIIEKFSIKIQTDLALLNIFADYLPKLKELKLNNSRISSITDLGSNFSYLTTLHVSRCQLNDLSGIFVIYLGILCFQNLEELEAAHNEISDISELEMCNNLKRLNLKDNLIEQEDSLFYISNLPLVYLNLTKNPLHEKDTYKELIHMYLPTIAQLDTESEDESVCVEGSMSTFAESTVNHNKLESPENKVVFNKLEAGLRNSTDSTKNLKPLKKVKEKLLGFDSAKISPLARENSKEEFDMTKSYIAKELKPVIVRKTIDVDEILLYKNNTQDITEEVISNIDKLQSSKNNILQNIIKENAEFGRNYKATKISKVIMLLNIGA